uniref:Uncharacterized protein n=1 Tax=Nelumbo nucifera TaxID=4432 RepID=A0A822XL96_NELNU|nr:TPA_asm: hypothetical protein HUJ06_021946 [Nelumbo nucifera]
MEDWENMLSEFVALLSQEQLLFRWIMGNIDDPSSGFKHCRVGVLRSLKARFGIVDQGFALESVAGGASRSGNVMSTTG